MHQFAGGQGSPNINSQWLIWIQPLRSGSGTLGINTNLIGSWLSCGTTFLHHLTPSLDSALWQGVQIYSKKNPWQNSTLTANDQKFVYLVVVLNRENLKNIDFNYLRVRFLNPLAFSKKKVTIKLTGKSLSSCLVCNLMISNHSLRWGIYSDI